MLVWDTGVEVDSLTLIEYSICFPWYPSFEVLPKAVDHRVVGDPGDGLDMPANDRDENWVDLVLYYYDWIYYIKGLLKI